MKVKSLLIGPPVYLEPQINRLAYLQQNENHCFPWHRGNSSLDSNSFLR